MIIATVSLNGAPGYTVGGTLTFKKVDNGIYAYTSDDFRFNGSPDPRFAFSNDTNYSQTKAQTNSILTLPGSGRPSMQEELSGRYTNLLPTNFDPLAFSHVFLWCVAVPTFLGDGRIEAA